MEIPDTLFTRLASHAANMGDRPALWTKKGGVYRATTWRAYHERVIHFALGLHQLGFKPKGALAIMGYTREEWVIADLAAMALGGVAVGVYTTSSPEQIQYVVDHSDAEIMVVENAAYLEVVRRLRPQLPKLRQIVVMEPCPGPAHDVIEFAEVEKSGAGADPSLFVARVGALRAEDLATLIYTSGTTGNPKGVMLSHRNICWTVEKLSRATGLGPNDVSISYLPLSHIAEQIASVYGPIMLGTQVYFAESLEKLGENLREVRPTAFLAVPRVWEKFKAKAEIGIAASPPHRRRLVAWSRQAALRRHLLALSGEAVPLLTELAYRAARKVVFSKLKAKIGLDRTRLFVSSTAPIGRDVVDFFLSIDVVLQELYGQSEVTGPTSFNVAGATRLGTVGRPMEGVEVRIADDGEVLVRGDNVCLGYFKDPAATAELIHDGWLHSGDLGELDGQGYLRITGRKKEIIVTSGGKKTPPANIEALLKSIPPVGNALVVGDRRNFLVALLPLDGEKVGEFARKNGFPEDPQRLAESPDFKAYLDRRIRDDVNSKLARFETIKKFAVLPNDFTVETGELTPTLKVRRKVAEAKYQAVIDALYSGTGSAEADAP